MVPFETQIHISDNQIGTILANRNFLFCKLIVVVYSF